MRQRSGGGAEDGIDFYHVCVIKKIEGFGDEVEMLVFAEGKIFHEAKIKVQGGRRVEGITGETERAGGKRKRVAAIGVHAGERIDGTSALGGEDGREFDVAEGGGEPAGFMMRARRGIFVVADGQIP